MKGNKRVPFALVVLLLALAGASFVPAAIAAQTAYTASQLEPHQGRYWKWTMPEGWRARESNSGVTLASPDGAFGAGIVTVLRSRGERTPMAFLTWVFTHAPGYGNMRVLGVHDLPSERLSYQVWRFIEAKVSYAENGLPVTGVYKVGVANYAGMNDAMMVGYRAANERFEKAQSFLPQIAKSIVLTNAAEANGNNTLVRPKNNPLDNSAIMGAYENRQKGVDNAMRNDANARRGTIDLYDSSTGERINAAGQNKSYYWRKPGSKEVIGTDTYTPPGVGYVPLTQY